MAGLQDVSVRCFLYPSQEGYFANRESSTFIYRHVLIVERTVWEFGIYSKEKFCAEIELSLWKKATVFKRHASSNEYASGYLTRIIIRTRGECVVSAILFVLCYGGWELNQIAGESSMFSTCFTNKKQYKGHYRKKKRPTCEKGQ